MSYYATKEIDRAARAYFRSGQRMGFSEAQLAQPSRSDSDQVGSLITLRGGGRTMARFRVDRRGKLRRLVSR